MALRHRIRQLTQELPDNVKILLALVFVFCLFTANPLLTVYAFVVIIVIFYNLWIPGQPPVLFIALALQWLQASTRIYQANLNGVTLNEYAGSQNGEWANFAALTALLIISFAVSWVIRRTRFDLERFYFYLERVNIRNLFFIFLAALVLLPLLRVAWVSGLAQIVHSLQSFKWALYCVLVFAAFYQKRGYNYLGIAFAIEFILGFTGYFSSFREVVIITATAATAFWHRVNFKLVIRATPVLIGLFSLLIVWQGVKKEYREYLSGGEESQAVSVARGEALDYLLQLVGEFSYEDFLESIELTFNRIQYTEMIQLCMDHVPAIVPHEEGKIWRDAILHIFTPRILFPNKPILDDSVIASKYTGIEWRGLEYGVSISIGYVAESYVDFGHYGLFIPVFFLGLFIGGVYYFFISTKNEKLLLDAGAVIPILLSFQLLETSGNKIIGGITMSVIVYLVIVRNFLYPVALRFILRK